MAKIQVTLDASKLRNLISTRSYESKDGTNVNVQEVKFELVEVKEPKQIFAKDTMRIVKTHFACVIQTKEEREAKADTVYIGEGFTSYWDKPQAQVQEPVQQDFTPDLPF